ncbi:MAG: hypothetical protein WBA57_18885 [Elainellaceae cyanobacterium]
MLMDWWLMDAPPLPLLIFAGVLLAIASNRDKRIRVSRDPATPQSQSAESNPTDSASKISPQPFSQPGSQPVFQPDSVTSPSSKTGQQKTVKTLAPKTVQSPQEKGKRRSPVLPKVSAQSAQSELLSPAPISFTIETPDGSPSPTSQE